MNYTLMQQGDILPTVGVMQKLLQRSGFKVQADGHFGPKTVQAVRDFQRQQGLIQDGIVGQRTWERIADGVVLPIVDSIDVFDPLFQRNDATFIRRAGGTPILLGGLCNGVQASVSLIMRSKDIFLLRFHGHGAEGVTGVSDGHEDGSTELSDIDSSPRILSILSQLRSNLGKYGSIQFVSCRTGRGHTGRQMLSKIASTIGAPASAAIQDQPFGISPSFRLMGPTITRSPGGRMVRDWCQALPDFPPGVCR